MIFDNSDNYKRCNIIWVMTFLCVTIFGIFYFYLKNYEDFNCRNLPHGTATFYNVINVSCCGG